MEDDLRLSQILFNNEFERGKCNEYGVKVLSWLSEANRQPFIVVGPDGCGKEELLKHCFTEDNQSQLAIVHSSAQSG